MEELVMIKHASLLLVMIMFTIVLLCGCESNVEDYDYTMEYNDKTYEGVYTGTLKKIHNTIFMIVEYSLYFFLLQKLLQKLLQNIISKCQY